MLSNFIPFKRKAKWDCFYKIWFQYIFQDNDEPEDEALETQEPVGVAEDNQCPDPNMEDQELEGNITLF